MNSSEFPNSQYNIEYYDVQPLIIASFCTHRLIFKLTEYCQPFLKMSQKSFNISTGNSGAFSFSGIS